LEVKSVAERILKPVSVNDVTLSGVFWDNYNLDKLEEMIDHQYSVFNLTHPFVKHGSLHALELLTGRRKDEEPFGMVWNDSDLFKWFEGLCYLYMRRPSEKWKKVIDYIVEMVEEAQQENGYFNTMFQLGKGFGKPFDNLRENHELYCMGNLIEAAIAHYWAPGEERLLNVAKKLADYIISCFGVEEGKRRGYCGHQEIEIAMVRLYRLTGEKKYLDQARYFLYERGREPLYFIQEWEERGRTSWWDFTGKTIQREHYIQTHLPMEEQYTAEGHAVRATYMYTAMADVAAETEDERLRKQCCILWDNIVDRRMYITGGVGALADGEAFGPDYYLPNKSYAETCAGIGMVYFAQRMLHAEKSGRYADILERVLYNNIFASTGLDLKTYFYQNRLERDARGEATRWPWQGCACCPTNIARFMTSMQTYVYSYDADDLYINLYAEGEASVKLDSAKVGIIQKTDYPWNGKVSITINPDRAAEFAVYVRIPGWCDRITVSVNGAQADVSKAQNGYLKINRTWRPGDMIALDMPMRVKVLRAHPFVAENHGKLAVMRGPVVYCIEDKDNGGDLRSLAIETDTEFEEVFLPDFLNGCVVLDAKGYRVTGEDMGSLYAEKTAYEYKPEKIRFIPYYTWSNRGNGEMLVWVWEKK